MKNYINAFAAVMLLGMCLDANVSAQDRIARYSGEVTLGYVEGNVWCWNRAMCYVDGDVEYG